MLAALLPVWVSSNMTHDAEAGKEVRRHKEVEMDRAGVGEWRCRDNRGRRWSGGSGSVSVCASAATAFSSAPCHVGTFINLKTISVMCDFKTIEKGVLNDNLNT